MVLGRYELLLPIAQGGMATVWAARQKGSRGFQKTVAIKTMLPALSEDEQFEKMFLDEAALAAKIHHPNVAEILDLGEQDDIIYLVMEWVDGEALSIVQKVAKKNQSQTPLRVATRIAMQACAGLHAAHELKDENEVPLQLVHRDVSPQNILVTYDGIVKLVDFGVAKAVGRASGETTAGQLKGKVPYMSPEQARGSNVDRRTDIFAMGIVLYKLTTGLHPFLGENDLVTMRNIISRPLLPPRVKTPSFPAELEQVLVKCLQKDPDKRYQTMSELAVALERALASMGVAEDDIGGYVRTILGDRGAKRRAEIREAVRQADERFATGTHPVAVIKPQVHEAVSEIVLTQLNTGVKEELLPERMSPSSVTGAPTSVPSSPAAAEPLGTTDQPVMAPAASAMEEPPQKKRRGGLIVAALVVAAGLLIGFVALRSSNNSSGTAAAPPTQTQTAAPAPTPVPTPSAVAEAPSATPSASALNIASLPNADDDAKTKKGGQVAKATDKDKPAPSGDPGPGKPIKPVSTQWVPTVKNPGF